MLYETRTDARLAPAFDIVCTDAYPEMESRMALALDGSDTWPNAKQFEWFGVRHCLIESRATREIIACVCDAAAELLPLLRDKRMPAGTAASMRIAIEEGVASLRG